MIINKKYESILMKVLKKRGIAIYQLADLVGVSRKSMYRYVNGERLPTIDIAFKIADALDDTVDYLFSDRF